MKLTAAFIKTAPDGRHGDGRGLQLHKSGESGKWIWRYSFAGKRREMGLGSFPTVSLKQARTERDKWALRLSQGIDPISERSASVAAQKANIERNDPALRDCVQMVFEARKATLKNEGKAGRWLSPIEKHILPKIGGKRISQIHQTDVRDALRPIWASKPATAEKAIQRLGVVFRESQVMGFECDPATITAARAMLGAVKRSPKPIAATPWQEVPALYDVLGDTIAGECLRLIILTAVRASCARFATVDQFDGDVWTIPAAHMKAKEGHARDFRVPLSDAAQDLVARMAAFGGPYLFTARKGRPLTDTSLAKRLNDMGEAGRPHGFRTSFRTWVQDTDATSWDVAETCLAHQVGGKVERSYARSDLLERRRPVMQAWADHVTGRRAAGVIRI